MKGELNYIKKIGKIFQIDFFSNWQKFNVFLNFLVAKFWENIYLKKFQILF